MEEDADLRVDVIIARTNALIDVWLAGEQLEKAMGKTASAAKTTVRVAGTLTANRSESEGLIVVLSWQ